MTPFLCRLGLHRWRRPSQMLTPCQRPIVGRARSCERCQQSQIIPAPLSCRLSLHDWQTVGGMYLGDRMVWTKSCIVCGVEREFVDFGG